MHIYSDKRNRNGNWISSLKITINGICIKKKTQF